MSDFKVGDTVFAVKDSGERHDFSYTSEMAVFAEGNVAGRVIRASGMLVVVDVPGHGAWNYGPNEVSYKPRKPVKVPRVSKASIRTKKVLAKAPKKVYAVVKGGSVYRVANRAEARELKFMLGGKAEGAIIVRYDITAEIR